MNQLSIFDWKPELALTGFDRPEDKTPDFREEPEVGSYVKEHGQCICHIMRKGYIGRKVVIDKSTVSHKWYRVGILENYFPHEGSYRAVVYTGSKQRELIDFYSGVEIYECLPWECYEERWNTIFKK